MEIRELIAEIRKDNKLPTEDLLEMLSDAIDNGEDPTCTYKTLYKKTYGDKLSDKLCKYWVETVGEKWSYEQAIELGQKLGVNWAKMSKYEWYATLNVWYSDYYRTAEIFQLENEAEFYGDLVLDYFVYDTDAKRKTVLNYYFDHVM